MHNVSQPSTSSINKCLFIIRKKKPLDNIDKQTVLPSSIRVSYNLYSLLWVKSFKLSEITIIHYIKKTYRPWNQNKLQQQNIYYENKTVFGSTYIGLAISMPQTSSWSLVETTIILKILVKLCFTSKDWLAYSITNTRLPYS